MTDKTIYKYPTPTSFDPVRTIELPIGAEIVTVGLDPVGEFCMWALVDPTAEPENRMFVLVGTGHPITHDVNYIGSIKDGQFMWHILEALA